MTTHALPAMAPHHSASIRNLVDEFERDSSVLALLLGGSLAHGSRKPIQTSTWPLYFNQPNS